MPEVASALEFLAAKSSASLPAVCVVFGDEPFLKRQVLVRLRHEVLGGPDADFSLTVLSGDTAELRDVLDELSTGVLFGSGRRLVIVEQADSFVTRNRAALEDHVAQPRGNGVLALEVDAWPSNTKLYKAVAAQGLPIDCKTPAAGPILKWLGTWSKQQHDAAIDRQACEELLEMIGPELGLLDQELAKLAAAAGPEGKITAELVDDLVTGGRAKTTWEMLDAAVDGDARTALIQLDLLLAAGENPIGLLAQISSGLRRFSAAARSIELAEHEGRRLQLRAALEAAGVKPFLLGKAEGQIKKLGRVRAGQLYRWLLDADLALKGSSSAPARARTVLEQLVVRMSDAADPRQSAAR